MNFDLNNHRPPITSSPSEMTLINSSSRMIKNIMLNPSKISLFDSNPNEQFFMSPQCREISQENDSSKDMPISPRVQRYLHDSDWRIGKNNLRKSGYFSSNRQSKSNLLNKGLYQCESGKPKFSNFYKPKKFQQKSKVISSLSINKIQ